MKLLLDTHIAFWFAIEPDRLNLSERAVLALPDMDMALSAVSLWELRVKWNRRFVSGERKGPVHPADVLAWYEDNEVKIVELTGVGAVLSLDPPLGHSDPFDELLLAQAQQTGRRLLTRDGKLDDHPIDLVAASPMSNGTIPFCSRIR